MNKNFKAIGFIRFKIGYTIHDNMLKMKKPIKIPEKKIENNKEEEDTIDDG